MQKIGDSTSTANEAGEFTEGNPAGGVPATQIKAAWLNSIQRELINLLKRAGFSEDKSNDSQVADAVEHIAGMAADFETIRNKPTTLEGYGITDAYTKPEVNLALGKKADNATTLGGYGIADAYTKTQVDSALSQKASTATTLNGYGITDAFTKAEVNEALSGKAAKATTLGGYGITDAYTKAQVDSALGQKAPTASPAFTGLPTAATAAKGTNTNQLATTEFVQNETANRLIVGAVSRQQPVLASPVNGSDYSAGATLIREAGEIGVSNPVEVRDDYAPAIGFSWQGKASGKLSMDYTGAIKWNGSPLLSSAALMAYGIGGQAISTETDLGKYKTGGKFITPATGLVGLPLGWAQGRHVIDVSGGDAYCEQTLNGVGANSGRKAWRVWDGSAWSGWFDAFSYQMEATLVDMVNKTSYNTYISPRRFADVAFGMNQTPQDVTASRTWAVNYTNTTNKTIFVSVHVRDPSGGNLSASLYIGGTLWAKAFMTGGSETTLEGPVAPGGSYALFREDTNDLIMKWTEFR